MKVTRQNGPRPTYERDARLGAERLETKAVDQWAMIAYRWHDRIVITALILIALIAVGATFIDVIFRLLGIPV